MVKLDLSIDEYNLVVMALGTLQVQTVRTLESVRGQAQPQINDIVRKEQELQQKMMSDPNGHS
jgi:hypothetical protein